MKYSRLISVKIASLVEAGSKRNPETLFRAVEKQVEPATLFLESKRCQVDSDRLNWMLTELVSNALTAPIGNNLTRETGLSRRPLLEAFGTSVIWPLRACNTNGAVKLDAFRKKIASATGCGADEFLGLPLSDKFGILKISTDKSWIRILVHCLRFTREFEMIVESDYACSKDDEAEILSRFEKPAIKKAEISSMRGQHVDGNGIYHIPSFTGGGGFGILACMETSAAMRLHFEYIREGASRGKTQFRIASFPVSEPGNRPTSA